MKSKDEIKYKKIPIMTKLFIMSPFTTGMIKQYYNNF